MHEIITLQLGQRSNYVATHFWNTQESYFTYSAKDESMVDHDVHFRAGSGPTGVDTYTPRTLIYDLKGGFGSMRKINELYDTEGDQRSSEIWSGSPAFQQQPKIEKHDYQQHLEQGLQPPPLTTESVRYWSDFNRVFFHPRSIVQLNEYELHSTLMPFEQWSVGEDLFNTLNREQDLFEHDFRFFAEECDLLQGVQILTALDDAWGGFAARYIEQLRDEMGKACLWTWGLEGSQSESRGTRIQKTVNMAKSIVDISGQSSLLVPILEVPSDVPSLVSVDPRSNWHTSALIMTALETVTLPARLRAPGGRLSTLSEMEEVLRSHGRQNIAQLRLMPGEPSRTPVQDSELDQRTHIHSGPEVHGNRSAQGLNFHQAEKLEMLFAPSSTQRKPSITNKSLTRLEMSRAKSGRLGVVEEDLDDANRLKEPSPAHRKSYHAPLPFPLLDSFPNIYGIQPAQEQGLTACASLSVDTSVIGRVSDLRVVVERAVGRDEREALLDGLSSIGEAYQDGWNSDEGSDEDDH
ncbi:MAG: mtDNA inheritance, partitioning of the mitochondrial organelle [Watsoniomyces obsoletus]|nr:MAG: mtDNA inheritance, partitioning of the mitochondrial organelle [Watsoniomyces obsoletus]